jgi:hypothetical protein
LIGCISRPKNGESSRRSSDSPRLHEGSELINEATAPAARRSAPQGPAGVPALLGMGSPFGTPSKHLLIAASADAHVAPSVCLPLIASDWSDRRSRCAVSAIAIRRFR